MKQALLGFLFLFLFGSAFGQTALTDGGTRVTTEETGGFKADSVLVLPVRDTDIWSFYPSYLDSLGVIQLEKNSKEPYFFNGLYWEKFITSNDKVITATVSSISTLEAYSGNANQVIVTDSNRGGVFYKSTTGILDSGICFPVNGGGYWKRIYNGNILATWFGAIGDSATDNTLALREWLASPYLATGTPYLPQGKYLISDSLIISQQGHYTGSAGFAQYQGTSGLSPVGYYSPLGSEIIQTTNKTAIRVEHNSVMIDGFTFVNTAVTDTPSQGIVVDSGYKFNFQNNFFTRFYDQLVIKGGAGYTIQNNQFTNPGRSFIRTTTYIGDEGDNLTQGNWFENIRSTDTGCYIAGIPGARFSHNKFHIPVGQTTGNYLSVPLFFLAATSSSDITADYNSIEAFSGTGVLAYADSTHTITKITFQGNNISNNISGNIHNISIITPVLGNILIASVTNNVLSQRGTWASVYLQGIEGFTVYNQNTPPYTTPTDSEVNCLYRQQPWMTGDVNSSILNGSTIIAETPLSGTATGKKYPNVFSFQTATIITGVRIIHTTIPRLAGKTFTIHVRGTNNTSALSTDFTVNGYVNATKNGSIDGQPGAIDRMSIADNGTDGLIKYVGIDSLGMVAIGIGSTGTLIGTISLSVDYDAGYGGSADSYISNWFETNSTTVNFNWKDITTFTLNQPLRGSSFASTVSNSDGTLTISPTSGAVIASLNLAHSNTWTANQTFPTANVTNLISTGALSIQNASSNPNLINNTANNSNPALALAQSFGTATDIFDLKNNSSTLTHRFYSNGGLMNTGNDTVKGTTNLFTTQSSSTADSILGKNSSGQVVSVGRQVTYFGTATLSSGTVTVSNTNIKTGTVVNATINTPSGTIGYLSVPSVSITNATSFVINSMLSTGTLNTADNSTVNWSFTISY